MSGDAHDRDQPSMRSVAGPAPNRIRRTLDFFTPSGRRRLYVVFAGVLATALLEVAGIASIMPFLTVVASPEMIHEQPLLVWMWQSGGFVSTRSFLFVLGGAVFGLILFANAIIIASTYLIQDFTWTQNHDLSKRLLECYIRQPWSFFLNHNTSDLGTKILSEIQTLIVGYVRPLLVIASQGLASIAIVVLLVAIDPVLAAVVTLIVGGAYALIYAAIRRRLARDGDTRKVSNKLRYRAANEALSGMKDVKSFGQEDAFLARFVGPSEAFNRSQTFQSVLALVPKNALEVVAFGAVLIILLYQLAVRSDVSQVIPVVGVYAFAGYRLMPKAQQVYTSLTQMRYHAHLLDSLSTDLHGLTVAMESTPADARPELESVLELRDATFSYEGASRPALRAVSLEIAQRSSVAFVGTTGSGKTTCVDVLLGLLTLDEGTLLVDGAALGPAELLGWRRRCGYVPQQVFLTDDTVAANIAFGVPEGGRDRAAVERAARIANLHDFIMTELPRGYDTLVGERGVRLSGGQRQRIGIARALYTDPDILFFDEATSALDGITERAIMDAMDRLSGEKTLVTVAHRLSTVRKCDRIYLFEAGAIAAFGTYDELLEKSVRFREMAAIKDGAAASA